MNFTSIKAQFNSNMKIPKRNNSTWKNIGSFLFLDDSANENRKRSAMSPDLKPRFQGLALKVEKDSTFNKLRPGGLETIAEKGKFCF